MNSFPNRLTESSLTRLLGTSHVDSQDVEIEAEAEVSVEERLHELHQDQDDYFLEHETIGTDYSYAGLEYEVLNEEFASGSQDETTVNHQQVAESIIPTNKNPAQWSRYTIHYLITSYKRLAHEDAYGRTNLGSNTIWTRVSRKLLQRGFTHTPEQCRTKWLMLKKLYQRIRNEEQLKKFEFIEDMHDYYNNPRVEQLLQVIKMRNQSLSKHKPRRRRKDHSLSMRNLAMHNLNAKLVEEECDATSMNEIEENPSHSEYYATAQEDDESDALEMGRENNFTTSELNVEDEQLEALDESQHDTLSDQHSVLVGEQHSSFIDEYRKCIEMQEQRRDERHKEKLNQFRVYNERLLAQQEKALLLHKQLMERLIEQI